VPSEVIAPLQTEIGSKTEIAMITAKAVRDRCCMMPLSDGTGLVKNDQSRSYTMLAIIRR
jgi:hypothetical protein